MLPWGHLGVAYLAYSLLVRRSTGQPPASGPAVALAVGSQLPDLVDKPLAWELGVLPTGRSLGHSLVVIAIIALAIRALATRRDVLASGTALVVGLLVHTLTDAIPTALAGEYHELGFLLWPLTPVHPDRDPLTRDVLTHLLTIEVTPMRYVGATAFVLAAVLWWLDGRPGVASGA